MKVSFIFIVLFCILLGQQKANTQVLHTENFNVVIDTTKILKGNFTPSFRYRNLKKDFLEIANTADVSFRFGKHAFTVANRVEYSLLGDDNILSGGFLYLEYINIQSKKIAIEPFLQVH
jgi:hypothetical protein